MAERELAGHSISGDQQIATGLKIKELAADLGIEIDPDETPPAAAFIAPQIKPSTHDADTGTGELT